MIKRGNKRGQIYLVAAIIIVMILAGIASVKTYAVATTEPRKIKDISSELKEETSRIIDYGIYSNNNLNVLLNSFDRSGLISPTKINNPPTINSTFLFIT